MTDKGRKYLSDILRAIELIESFVESIDSFEEFDLDYKTQSAVERQLGIIGEAVNKFNKTHPEITLEDSEKIVGFRNRIIHAYDSVDNSIVWVIIKRYLEPLKKSVDKIL